MILVPEEEPLEDQEALAQYYETIHELLLIVAWLMGVFMWLGWVEALGGWGPLVYALLYVLATNIYLPGWLLQVGAGFLFGMGMGLATMLVSITSSALACLCLTRWACAECVRRRLQRRWPERYRRLSGALLRHDWKVLLLLRLSPACPFTATNQMLALLEVRWQTYAVTTFLGTTPNALMYVSLGAAAHSFSEATRARCSLGDVLAFRCGSAAQEAVVLVGVLATVVLVPLLAWLARRALRRYEQEEDPDDATLLVTDV